MRLQRGINPDHRWRVSYRLGVKALSSHKKGVLAALIKLGDVDESRIGSKFAGYVRNQVLCNTMKYPHITKEFWSVLPNLIENGTLRPTTFQVVDGLDIETVDTFLVNYSRGLGQTKPHFHLGNTFAY